MANKIKKQTTKQGKSTTLVYVLRSPNDNFSISRYLETMTCFAY